MAIIPAKSEGQPKTAEDLTACSPSEATFLIVQTPLGAGGFFIAARQPEQVWNEACRTVLGLLQALKAHPMEFAQKKENLAETLTLLAGAYGDYLHHQQYELSQLNRELLNDFSEIGNALAQLANLAKKRNVSLVNVKENALALLDRAPRLETAEERRR